MAKLLYEHITFHPLTKLIQLNLRDFIALKIFVGRNGTKLAVSPHNHLFVYYILFFIQSFQKACNQTKHT